MQSKLYGVNISPNINKEAKSFCNNIFLVTVFLFRTSEGRKLLLVRCYYVGRDIADQH